MGLIQLACLILVTTFVKVSEAQCYGRNKSGSSGGGVSRAYLPVVLTDPNALREVSTWNPTCTTGPGQSSSNTVLTNDELNALLKLARVLESDKTACATKGIDVDRLLETLVTALVYTTTHTVDNTPVQNNANALDILGQNGLVDKLLSIILEGQSSTNSGGMRSEGHSSTVATESNNGQGLVELDLGQDGFELKIGDLVNANLGGKRTTSSTSSASSEAVTSTTSKTVESVSGTRAKQTVNNGDKGLLGKDGLLGNIIQSEGGGVVGEGGVVDGASGTLAGVK